MRVNKYHLSMISLGVDPERDPGHFEKICHFKNNQMNINELKKTNMI